MLKKLFIISSLLFLSACDTSFFEGVISVKQQMLIKSNMMENVTVPAGDYGAKLEFISREQIRLNLIINGKNKQLNLYLPKKLNLPDNGPFVVSSKDLGQDFGAQGESNTVVTDTQIQRGWEHCTYQRSEVVCYPQGCYTEWRTVYGQQQVEFFDRVSNQKISVNFINEQNASLLSNFGGERNFSERIYTYKGMCY